jgi:transcriptional regulator with XRE-family HTH domain
MRRTRRLDNYLRTYRRRAGFSQSELAYLLGTRDGAKVSRYERNSRLPSFDALLAMTLILGVPIDELFAGRVATTRGIVRRRAAFLKRRILARPQTAKSLRPLISLSRILRSPQ